MATSGVGGVGSTGTQTSLNTDAFSEVDMDVFLKLLIAELQNQDPLSPMDNNQILQQVSQIREIESNTRLTDTLEGVLLGQAMSTASSLLGQEITGLTSDGTKVSGKVERVSVVDGEPKLQVGGYEIALTNVSQIVEPAQAE